MEPTLADGSTPRSGGRSTPKCSMGDILWDVFGSQSCKDLADKHTLANGPPLPTELRPPDALNTTTPETWQMDSTLANGATSKVNQE